jgi:PAS domain S-box-containing protein
MPDLTPPSSSWDNGGAPQGFTVTGFRAYLLAAACVAIALLARLLLDPFWTTRLPYSLFFLSVIIMSQFTEAGPTSLTCLAGYLLGNWFFVGARHSLLPGAWIDQVNGALYFLVCALVYYFSSRMRRAVARERAAADAFARVAAIIESSEDAVIGKDLTGNILTWNAGATKLYGYSEAEAIGQTISFLMETSASNEMPLLLQRVAKGEQIQHFETRRRTKDGRIVNVSLSISPVRNSAGKIIGASTIARDVTERKRAEAERERLLSELQTALRQVKTLSGMLPICSYCKKIRDDKGYWNKIEQYLHKHAGADFTHSVCPDCAESQFSRFSPSATPGQPS